MVDDLVFSEMIFKMRDFLHKEKIKVRDRVLKK